MHYIPSQHSRRAANGALCELHRSDITVSVQNATEVTKTGCLRHTPHNTFVCETVGSYVAHIGSTTYYFTSVHVPACSCDHRGYKSILCSTAWQCRAWATQRSGPSIKQRASLVHQALLQHTEVAGPSKLIVQNGRRGYIRLLDFLQTKKTKKSKF